LADTDQCRVVGNTTVDTEGEASNAVTPTIHDTSSWSISITNTLCGLPQLIHINVETLS